MRSFPLACAAAIGLLLPALPAAGQSYSNPAPIVIPASGAAAPYPSTITVAGNTSRIEYVRVTLRQLTHPFPDDLDVVLVSPTGLPFVLMSDAGGAFSLDARTIAFAPDALTPIGNSSISSTESIFLPADYTPADTMPAPCPPGPYSTDLNALRGFSPNGAWSLYVFDDTASNAGELATGWSIEFNGDRVDQPIPVSFTYQGRLEVDGAPYTGEIDARFRVWDHATSTAALDSVTSPVLVVGIPVSAGVFSATPVFALPSASNPLTVNKQTWLEVEVAAPSGSGVFTVLSRQPITPTPVAHFATRAQRANEVSYSGITSRPAHLDIWTLSGQSDLRLESPDFTYRVGINTGFLVGTFAIMQDRPTSQIAGHSAEVLALYDNEGAVLGLHGNADTESAIWFATPFNSQFAKFAYDLAAGPRQGFVWTVNGASLARLSQAGRFAIGLADSSTNTGAIHAIGGDTLTLAGGGVGIFGPLTGANIGIGPTAIQARSAGASSSLALNPSGGTVLVGNTGAPTANTILLVGGGAAKPNGGSWGVLSDARMKHNITPASPGTLDRLLALRAYTFEYTPEALAAHPALPGPHFGLLAQEVEQIFPSWISEDPSGIKYVTEQATTALMVEALRDLRAEKDRAVAELRAQNQQLRARLERLERALEARP